MAETYAFYNPCNMQSESDPGYSTDIEIEYDETEHEHCYNLRHDDAILDRVFRRGYRQNLPRKQGHYKLETRVKKVHDSTSEQVDRYYSGHHWEVDGRYHSESDVEDTYGDEFNNRPLQLERTTLKLTIIAVQDAMDAEKRRRERRQTKTGERALSALIPLNQEFAAIINRNEARLKTESKEFVREMGDAKDEFMIELTRKYYDGVIESEFTEEQERRMCIYDEMTDSDQNDAELLVRLKSLAINAEYWKGLQCELTGAFSDLDEIHNEEDHAVTDIFTELKDEFIHSFQRATNLMKLHMTEEKEKRRRLCEARDFAAGKKDIDIIRRRTMRSKAKVDEELHRLNAGVTKTDCCDEGVGQGLANRVMDHTLEVLVHRVTAREVDMACAKERSTRLEEIAHEMQFGDLDTMKEALKDAMVYIQEQMLMSKFHGHKVATSSRLPQRDVDGQTDQDRKLRTARLKSRRQSCVVADF